MNKQPSALARPSTNTDMFEKLVNDFKNRSTSGKLPELYCFSPGRLNIIGEHIDYCGGHVLPTAISMGTYAVANSLTGNKIIIYSLNYNEQKTFTLEQTEFIPDDGWMSYPKGVFHLLQNAFPGQIRHGLEIFVTGNLPMASGLSSSASLLLCMIQIAKETYGLEFSRDKEEDKRQTALFAKKVENEYIGLECGIMDQGSIVFGRKHHLMLMDCNTLDIEYLPFSNERYTVIIADTNKLRKLSESKYNERKKESEEALKNIRRGFEINHLCEIDEKNKDAALKLINDPKIKKRAGHIINENLRVFKVKEALLTNEPEKLGRLLTEGHMSLKNDYEVTGKELDSIVEHALRQPEVLGARMTGAGFSGSALILMKDKNFERALSNIAKLYEADTGYSCTFYPFSSSDGVTVSRQIIE